MDSHAGEGDEMTDNRSPEQIEQTAARQAEILRLRREGKTFQQIGDALGFSRQYAHELYWRAIGNIVVPEAAALRAAQREELEGLMEQAMRILQKDHVAVSQGKVVRLGVPDVDEDGEPIIRENAGEIVHDDMPKLAAIKELRQLHERMAKLMGLDTPVRQDVNVGATVKYVVEGVDTEAMK